MQCITFFGFGTLYNVLEDWPHAPCRNTCILWLNNGRVCTYTHARCVIQKLHGDYLHKMLNKSCKNYTLALIQCPDLVVRKHMTYKYFLHCLYNVLLILMEFRLIFLFVAFSFHVMFKNSLPTMNTSSL